MNRKTKMEQSFIGDVPRCNPILPVSRIKTIWKSAFIRNVPRTEWSWLAVSQIVVGGLSSVIVEVSKETYHFGSSYANSIWKQKSAE